MVYIIYIYIERDIKICLKCHLEISGQPGKKKETPSFFPHIVTSSIRILKYIEYPTRFQYADHIPLGTVQFRIQLNHN